MAIPTRIDVFIGQTLSAIYNGGGTNYVIETPTGVIYLLYIDNVTSDPVFTKSLDGGMSWSAGIVLKATVGTQLSVWYDRWTDPTGVLGDLIHVCYTSNATGDVYYRNINTASADALSTEYTIFNGSSTATPATISITRTRGGNLLCCGCIDNGAEPFAKKSTDVGVNWSDIAAVYEAAGDGVIMMPGFAADNQDAICIYYDRDATEISRKLYDDSANSWSESSIATSISLPAFTSSLNHCTASIDHSASQIVTVFWTAVDTLNADLKCYVVNESAITAKTDVVLNSVDDQGFACISISGTTWYCFYCGKSDGSETYNIPIKRYYKISTDGGTTWGAETNLSNYIINPYYMTTKMIYYKSIGVFNLYESNYMLLHYNAPLVIPRSTYVLGM